MKYKKGDMVFIKDKLYLGAYEIQSVEKPKEGFQLMTHNVAPKYRVGDEILYASDLVDTEGAVALLARKFNNIKDTL